MDTKNNPVNTIRFQHPDPWRNAYIWAADDLEKLRQLCELLLKDKRLTDAALRQLGLKLNTNIHPPQW